MGRGLRLRCAGAILGCLIGAGFASGQEVLQFFTAYGPVRGLLGAGLMLVVLGGVTAALLGCAAEAGGGDCRAVLGRWLGVRLGGAMAAGLPAVCFCVYAVMLAGAGALLSAAAGLPPGWGSGAMFCLTLASVLAGFNRLMRVLGFAGPVIVAVVLLAGAGALGANPAGVAEAGALAARLPLPRAGGWWWLSALEYGGCNAVLLAPFLASLGGLFRGRAAAARRTGWAACGVFALAVALLHLGLSAHLAVVGPADVPVVALAAHLWPGSELLVAPLLLAGVYTTAVPMLLGAAPGGTRPAGAGRTALVAVAGWGCSALPFPRLIGLLYPLIGWAGLVCAVWAAGRRLGRRRSPARRSARPAA